GIRRLLAEDHADERRLARPIRTDQSDARARAQMGGRVLEQDARGKLLIDVLELQHGCVRETRKLAEAGRRIRQRRRGKLTSRRKSRERGLVELAGIEPATS